MSKAINKAATLDALKGEFLATIGGMTERSAAFQRRIVLEGVKAVRTLHAGLAALPEADRVSVDKLHTDLSGAAGSVSKSTLDRWGRVAALHGEIEPSEGSASAVYALTEGGMTAARDAFKASTPTTADEIVDAAVEAINSHPKVKAVKAVKQPTAADVLAAGFTPEAFAQSVTDLLDKVPADQLDAARKQLRAIVNGYKREAVSA